MHHISCFWLPMARTQILPTEKSTMSHHNCHHCKKKQKKAERKDSHNALNQRTRAHNLMGSAVPKLATQQNAVPWRRLPGLRTYNGAAVAALRKLHILQKMTLSVSNSSLKNSLIKQSYFQLVRKSSHRFACKLAGTTSSFLITQPRITRSRL